MKKGFTLIELLAVIVILAIILLIAVPQVLNVIEDVKNNAYISTNDLVVDATELYMASHIDELPSEEGNTVEVTLNELENYIDDVSAFGNTCSGYVLITKVDEDNYSYNPQVNCSSKITNNSAEDGLVAYYTFDDFQESTVNLINNPTYEKISPSNEFMRYTDLAPFFDLYGTDTAFSLSADIKSLNTANEQTMRVYMQNGSSTKYAFVYSNVELTEEYQTFVFQNIFPRLSTATDVSAYLAFYGTYSTGNYPAIKNVQLEKKDHATPFVDGTRIDTVKDYSQNNNSIDLDVDSTPTWILDSERDSGVYKFNGSNTEITKDDFDGTIVDEGSYVVWFKATSEQSSNSRIVEIGLDNNRVGLYLAGGKKLCFYILQDEGYILAVSLLSLDALNDNKWHFATATWGEEGAKLYIDGVLEDFTNDEAYSTTVSPSSLCIGKYVNESGYNFNGLIDDVRVYDRVLNEEEVKEIYLATK